MKLLVFSEIHFRGGGNKYMVDCINSVSKHYKSIILLTNKKELFPEDKNRLNCDVIIHSINFLSKTNLERIRHKFSNFLYKLINYIYQKLYFVIFLINTIKFYFVIKKISPTHILSANGGYPAALSSLSVVVAAKLLKIPVLLSIVSMPVPREYFAEKLLDKIIWQSVDGVIVNCRAIATALSYLRNMPLDKVDVVFNGIENKKIFMPKEEIKDEFIIGCIARMDESKGVLLLLDAFKQISEKYDHVKLVLVGKGNASAVLQQRVSQYGLSNKVELLGHYENNIFNLIEKFDVYVLPSFWEGLPYSLIEALYAACPIISTKVGGISEVITDAENGLLIDVNSIQHIVISLNKLINDSDLRKYLAINGRKKFETMLTLNSMQIEFESVFQQRCV